MSRTPSVYSLPFLYWYMYCESKEYHLKKNRELWWQPHIVRTWLGKIKSGKNYSEINSFACTRTRIDLATAYTWFGLSLVAWITLSIRNWKSHFSSSWWNAMAFSVFCEQWRRHQSAVMRLIYCQVAPWCFSAHSILILIAPAWNNTVESHKNFTIHIYKDHKLPLLKWSAESIENGSSHKGLMRCVRHENLPILTIGWQIYQYSIFADPALPHVC